MADQPMPEHVVGQGADSSSSGPTVVDTDNPPPLTALSYAQLSRRYAGRLDGLVAVALLDGGAGVLVPETGATAFVTYVCLHAPCRDPKV
jgi:hypothetical protein